MLTGELRNKIDSIWTMLWTEGSTNPLTNIEQITYMIFMKELDNAELKKEEDAHVLGISHESIFPKDKPEYRWNTFKNFGNSQELYGLMVSEIFPFIRDLKGDSDDTAFSKYMKDAIFQINQPSTLQKLISVIDQLPTGDSDVQGDIYEHLLSKLQTSGTNGQFRTPRHIIKMMVNLVKPKPDDVISDPAMATAGFLAGAGEYLRDHHGDLLLNPKTRDHYHNNMFHGNDTDRTMLRIGAMNMMLHGVENPQIFYRDSLSESNDERDKYSLILANPPFTGSLDYETTSKSLLTMTKTKKTELLFLALFLRTLKPGGRAAVIVPDGVLFGTSNAHKSIRKAIIEDNKLEGVISMPSGVFKPYAGVSTAVLLFTKTNSGGTDKVWFYNMENDGFTLNDNRSPIEENDIPDIIERFSNMEGEEGRERTDKSFLIPVEEIIENGYDLSINRYKEIVYEEVEYDEPGVIIGRIKDLNRESQEILGKLEELVE